MVRPIIVNNALRRSFNLSEDLIKRLLKIHYKLCSKEKSEGAHIHSLSERVRTILTWFVNMKEKQMETEKKEDNKSDSENEESSI